MADLRSLFESLGFGDVATHIQSGNVLFSSTGAVSVEAVEDALGQRFSMQIDVMVRSAAQLAKVVAGNPFPKADAKVLHVGFLAGPPSRTGLGAADLAPFAPEEAVVRGTEVYFHLPAGMARTKLPAFVDRRLGVAMTVRNWNTTTKLLELSTS